jgi:imidazoleglycerol-phosphate dehydratase
MKETIMREFIFRRDTSESNVLVDVGLDEYSEPKIESPIKFFNHMMQVFSFHSRFKLEIEANSIDGDPHHIIEDIAITLGIATKNALGDKRGINRYGCWLLPMDESLVMTSVDVSGRPYACVDLDFKNPMIHDMPSDLVNHFFTSFANHLMGTIHVKQMSGANDHHIAEAAFKSFAFSMAKACSMTNKYNNLPPSSKGVL